MFLCFFIIYISDFIKNNIIYSLIPLFIPMMFSLVGLNDYKIESNSEYLKIYSNCILMGMFLKPLVIKL